MSKKDIRMCYICTKSYHESYIENILASKFNIIRDNKNPEYILVGEGFVADETTIYDNKAIKKFFNLYKNAITIFCTFESILPDFNYFDYIIARDDIKFEDRCIRTFYNEDIDENKTKGISIENAREILKQKKYFCNFIYSHMGQETRELIFNKVSEYKFVHSMGKHLKNCDIKIASRDDYFNGAIEAKRDFKFSIAAENGFYRNGVTEKIYTSFLANTIPIYFGDTNINHYFNKEAFINYHDYKNIDDFINRIKEIDNNDDIYLEILSKPIITKSQYDNFRKEINISRDMILSIFERDIENSRRKPDAAFVNWHAKRIKKRASRMECIINIEKILNTLAWLIPIKSLRDNFKKKYL